MINQIESDSILINDDKKKRLCMKKRRIALVKKAMQLSHLTECEITMQVYWKGDGSLVEYRSHED